MSHTIGCLSARLCNESSQNDFSVHLREAAEDKLYYLRDTLTPEEFDLAVDQELVLACKKAMEREPQLKVVARKLVTKVVKLVKKQQ